MKEIKQELLDMMPQEIKNIILEYTTTCSIYNGTPMLKIPKDDERYKIISEIPKIIKNTIYQYESHYGCKTIVWFSSGAQLMYCNDERSYLDQRRFKPTPLEGVDLNFVGNSLEEFKPPGRFELFSGIKRSVINHSILFRMRRIRKHRDDHKWKTAIITKIE